MRRYFIHHPRFILYKRVPVRIFLFYFMILEESQLLFSTMCGLNAASLTTLKGNYIIKYSMWSGIVPFRAARV